MRAVWDIIIPAFLQAAASHTWASLHWLSLGGPESLVQVFYCCVVKKKWSDDWVKWNEYELKNCLCSLLLCITICYTVHYLFFYKVFFLLKCIKKSEQKLLEQINNIILMLNWFVMQANWDTSQAIEQINLQGIVLVLYYYYIIKGVG